MLEMAECFFSYMREMAKREKGMNEEGEEEREGI